MPPDHYYGVVAGTFASFSREDPRDDGHWYHGRVRVDTPAGRYEAALDVDAPSGVGVGYRLVTDLRRSDLPLLSGSCRVYVLGEPYTRGPGVHNVHLDQGDPPGPYRAEDGIRQDGAVLCENAAGALRVWQVEFTTQPLHTDGTGAPV